MPTPIPSNSLEKFSTFGDLLRFLRRRAGITQMELSIAVGYSDAQISRLEQNLRLPDIPMLEARFIPALGLENEPKATARLLELAANVRREDAPGLGLCPYKGLNYFDEADADLFVGRESLTARLTERVVALTRPGTTPLSGKTSSGSPETARFLAIVGASGSGKSSLVRAGLVPALRWEKESADWHIHILTPAAHPLESLAASLTADNNSITTTTRLMDDLAHDSRSLQIWVKRRLQHENNTHLLLVIDQFEELFTLCRADEEKASFIGNLLTASSEAHGPISVIITLRADFYAHCADYIHLREALAHNQEYIGAMSDEELRRAIEEPARRGRWELEPGLVDLLLHDVGHEPGALPLLSHALLETWQRRRARTMTLSGYASSGGVRGAIAETAETLFADHFTPDQQTIARRIFLRLTELNDETYSADTRRRASFDELFLKPEETAITRFVLKALADARLITTSEKSAEVAHEALIREWPTLRGWLEENREGLRIHRQLTEAAQEWHTLERAPDMLFRGARLAQTREWSATHDDEINTLEREFLTTSINAAEFEVAEREAQRQRELEAAQRLAATERQHAEEQRHTSLRLRKSFIYLAAAAVIALVMAVAAIFFGKQAQISSRLSISRELAAASINQLEIDPEQSVLLALQALDTSYTIEADEALHQAVQASHLQLAVPAHEPGAPMMAAFSPDGRQFVTAAADESVKVWDATSGKKLFEVHGQYASYSPDGKQLAITLVDGTVNILDSATGNNLQTPQQVDADLSVTFDPAGTRLATVVLGETPKVWDVKTSKEIAVFAGHTDYVSSVMFSPDGTRLLSVSDDGTARVWDIVNKTELFALNHPAWVMGGAFSPDGRRIVTISGKVVYLWDAITGQQLLTLSGHKNPINAVAYSPDGLRIATGSVDGKIKLWNATTGEELSGPAGRIGVIYSIAFSPDGTRLITGSDDGTARVWDLTPSHELLKVTGRDSSGQIAFSVDGSRLAIADDSGNITIHDVRTGKGLATLQAPTSLIKGLVFSPDGKKLIVSYANSRIGIWDITSGNRLTIPSGHTAVINAITIARDGKYVATASDDYKVKVWNIDSGTLGPLPLFTLEHASSVYSVAFNPNAYLLAAGIQDGTVQLWDMNTGKGIRILRGHSDFVTGIAFSPNGTRMATASGDGSAKVWNVATGEELLTLRGHTGAVTAIAYSPDGKRIATVGQDGTTKLWDAATGSEVLTLFGDAAPLSAVAFSPNGKYLATSGDSSTQIYLLNITDLIAWARTRVTRSLTTEECQKYLHRTQSNCAPLIAGSTTTPIPPTDQGRVCQVTNTGDLFDHSFNEMIYTGLQEVHAQYHWDAQVLQSSSTQDFGRNIQEFIRGDCDLIVGMFSMADAMQAAAEAHPHQKFQMMDYVSDQPLSNIRMQVFATDQAAFLAGYLAAATTKTGKVGVFGGIDIPSVTDFMDGFALGVQYYNAKNNTGIETLGWDPQKHQGLFVGGFCCAAEGRQLTQQLLDQGADIILPVAGTNVGPGAAYAVQTHGNAYIIGVDTDWALTQPKFADIILTSVVKDYDVSVTRAVKAINEDTFAGGIQIGTLDTGEVSLAPFHMLDGIISVRIKAELEAIKADIRSGKIKTKP